MQCVIISLLPMGLKMSNASTLDVQKLIRYHFDNRVLRKLCKNFWYDAEWDELYNQVIENRHRE